MTPLRDALYSLEWGSDREESTPLSPAQCRALLEYIRKLEGDSSVPMDEDGEEVGV